MTHSGFLSAAGVRHLQCDHLARLKFSPVLPRAFIEMRAVLKDTRELAAKLSALEQDLKSRLDLHEAAIVDVLQRIMRILEPPAELVGSPEPPKPEI